MKDASEKRAPQRESLSFEALMEEMGEISVLPAAVAVSEDARVSGMNLLDGGTVIVGDESPSIPSPKDELPFRVLTGSSPQPMALWLQGTLATVLALLFLIPVMPGSETQDYQPGISLVVIMLAGGAGLWSLYGLKREKTPSGKRRCWAAAAFSLFVVALAFWVRMPGAG